MKRNIFFTTLIFLTSFSASAQLVPNNKIYLEFLKTTEEVNVDGSDAVEMLHSYIRDKTTLNIIASKEDAEYILTLSVVEKNMGKRKGRILISENASGKVIFDTEWQKANSTAFYGYSGTRAVIGKMVKQFILKSYPLIAVDD